MPRSTTPRFNQTARPAKSRAAKPAARNDILDELRSAVDEADLRIILKVFQADVDAQLNDLQDFVSGGKSDSARSVAHRLAGLLAQFGATTAAETSRRLAKSASAPATSKDVTTLARAARKAVAEICATVAEPQAPAVVVH
jgi:HPt (histidine-containing phosphotransfer) domain-containing protein